MGGGGGGGGVCTPTIQEGLDGGWGGTNVSCKLKYWPFVS